MDIQLSVGKKYTNDASLKWEMMTDAEGTLSDAISLTDAASKGKKGGRSVPLNKELRAALEALRVEALKSPRRTPFVITTERACQTSSYAIVNMFAAWYRELCFSGASSHSGRRTAITAWAIVPQSQTPVHQT
jgi:integrase